MDIDGFGEKMVNQLIDNKIIKNISDIFYLNKDDLINIERMGDKSINNIINAINSVKKIALWRFIHGLGIRNIGENASKILGKKYNKIENLFYLNLDDLIQTEEIGNISAECIIDFFNNINNINIINRCLNAGLIFKELEGVNNNFKGISFAITGTLNIARSIMKSKLESVGAKVVSSVSSKTNYLICGENPGKNKTNKANELSVQLISESDVLDMIDN